MLLCLYHQTTLAQSSEDSLQPTVVFEPLAPVSIEEADQILRARMPDSAAQPLPANAQVGPNQAPSTVGALQPQTCSSGSVQPLEITTLAASLKCDVDLIFEYVYNNIEYEPLFGSNKGPLGTLLDLRGSDSDQVQLFLALLQAAGFTQSQFNLQYGYIRLNGAQASGWLGVKNDGRAIDGLIALGGIPRTNVVVNGDGTLARLDVAHVWAQVQIGGVSYVFDPSYKQHTIKAGLSNLGTILGYTQSGFLANAGGSTDSVSIWNINRGSLRGDLVNYANNLIGYIKNYNLTNSTALTLNDIIGGKTINSLTGSPLRQATLPTLSPSQPSGFPQNWGATVPDAYRTCFTISMPGVSSTPCPSASSQTIKLFSDQTYGRRITVSSVPSSTNYVPTLLIDGALPPNGQNTGPATSAGSTWNISVCILHPYTNGGNGCRTLPVTAGGTYLIGAGWGQVGRGMVEKHRRLLVEAQAAGNPATSELVLGESLAVISYTWLAEVAAAQQIGDAIGKLTTLYHHGVGITAQAPIQKTGSQAPYVDLPLNFTTLQSQTFSGSGISPAIIGPFYAISGMLSSLESAVLEQTQALVTGIQAASTIRLVDMNAATGAKTYFVDGTAAGLTAYFTASTGVRAGLVTGQYSQSDLNFIDCQVSTDCKSTGSPRGIQLVLPANGNALVGQQWRGAGYSVIIQTASSISILQRISGGLSGGFSGSPVPTPELVQSTGSQMAAPLGSPPVPASVFANGFSAFTTFISDPVDAVAGGYAYQRTDLATGSGSLPYALAFGRSYSSARNLSDGPLGNGWAHNFSIAASRSSDPFAGLGEGSAISAAAAIAASYISQDLLSGTRTAQTMTVSWMVARWLTDQLTNNSVTISWPNTSEQFNLLPHTDGSPTATYDPPLGSAVVLTGSEPDAYGNYTTFNYLNKDQSQLSFNSLNASAPGSIANWTFPYGMSIGFAYNYAYNGTNYLSSVTNTLGRSLSLSYTGAHVSNVADETGRSVSFGYDANNNLTSSVDPLQFTTSYAYDGNGRLTQVFYPGRPSTPFLTNAYDAIGRVNKQADAYGNISTFYLAGSRTEFIDALGNRHVTYQTPRGRITKDASVLSNSVGNVFSDTPQQNGLLNVTTNTYDGFDRLVLTTAPEGGKTAYVYDPSGNVLSTTATPKPGSPLSPQVTSYLYDTKFGKPIRVTDPRGLVTSMGYDTTTGNLASSISDAGSAPHFNARQSFTYSGIGQLLTSTDPLGIVTQYTYDNLGNQISVLRDAGAGRLNQLSSFTYNARGDVVTATDPRGNVTTSTYDNARQPLSTTVPNGVVSTNTYDPNGQVIRVQQSKAGTILRTTSATYTLSGKTATSTDANGGTTSFAYDQLDRVSTVTGAIGRKTAYGYDALGRQISVSNAGIQGAPLLQQAYTPDGLVASLTDANNHTTTFAYDGLDRPSATTYPLGGPESRTYDADNNVLTRTTRAGQTITFTYDTLNRLASKTPPAPAPAVTYRYDLAGRLVGVSDNSAAIAAALPPLGSFAQYITSYSYDTMNRPTTVSWTPAPAQAATTPSSVTFGHSYNKANQRIGQTVTDNAWLNYPAATASTTSYTANALNQYTVVGAVTPSYDGDGNLTSDGTFTIGYDVENRLTSASGAGNVATYTFDAQGRRRTKTVNGTTTVFVTDADHREVLEYDGSSGAVQRWYAYGLGPNAVLNQMNVAAATRVTLVPDILGSIVGSLDSDATSPSKVGYLPYGKSASAGPFGFTGQRIDTEIGGLYYYRARHYAPALGRFTQVDPAGYGDGPLLYAYVGNDPLNLVDPFGLERGSSSGSSVFDFVTNRPAATLGIAAAVVGVVACVVAEPCGAIVGGGSLAVAGGGSIAAGGTVTAGSAIAITGVVGGTTIAAADILMNQSSDPTKNLVASSTPGRETKGSSTLYDRPGGFGNAQNDFNSLAPTNVRPAPNNPAVQLGTLPDGRTVTVRPTSSDGRPTLEIYNPANGRSIKFRYGP